MDTDPPSHAKISERVAALESKANGKASRAALSIILPIMLVALLGTLGRLWVGASDINAAVARMEQKAEARDTAIVTILAKLAALETFAAAGGRVTVADLWVIVPCEGWWIRERLREIRSGKEPTPSRRDIEELEKCYSEHLELARSLPNR